MRNDPKYDSEYFQMLKNSPRYERKKKQNRLWNHSEEGKKYKRQYMRKWYAKKRTQNEHKIGDRNGHV